MKVAVCIKYVPKIIDNAMINRNQGYGIINPPDLYAIEEAIRLKERLEVSTTVGICMGVISAQKKLKQALAMGIDEVYLLSDIKFSGADTFSTSYILSNAIKTISDFKLIICGNQSVDGGTGQVAQEIASHLDYPCITNVVSINKISGDKIECTILSDNEYQIINVTLPAVISVLKGINEPRTPSIKGLQKAQEKKIVIFDCEKMKLNEKYCGTTGSRTRVLRIYNHKLPTKYTKDITCDYLKTIATLIMNAKKNEQVKSVERRVVEHNYKNTDKLKEIWVVCQVENGFITEHSYQILTKAAELLTNAYVLCVVLLEMISDDSLDKLSYYGIKKMYYCMDYKSSVLFDENQVETLLNMCKKYKPSVVLLGSSTWGRWLAPIVAVKLKTGLTADCIDLKLNDETGILTQIRSVYGGNSFADIICPVAIPQMATVRFNVFTSKPYTCKQVYEIIRYKCMEYKAHRIQLIEKIDNNFKNLNLFDADIIICGGRGVGGRENFQMLFKLAEIIGGAIGATRYAVDAGWVEYSYQIGQTGKSIYPKLFISVGVSGASEHLVGVRHSDCVISINIDKNAPIMKISDFAILDDCNKVIKNMIKYLEEREG